MKSLCAVFLNSVTLGVANSMIMSNFESWNDTEELLCGRRRNEESLWRADFFKDCLAAKDIRLKVRTKSFLAKAPYCCSSVFSLYQQEIIAHLRIRPQQTLSSRSCLCMEAVIESCGNVWLGKFCIHPKS